MKRVILYFVLFGLLFTLSNCEKKTKTIVYDNHYKKEIKKLRDDLSVYMLLNNIPGGTFAVSIDGKLVYSEGIGLASKDLEVPVSRKTKFRIGNVSELFTSLIYQMMIENGTLNPDSTIQSYFPDYPLARYKETSAKITLRQLANHSSGISQPADNDFNYRNSNFTLQNSIEIFKDYPLNFLPDWDERPSAYNYQMLGAIMEKVSGKHFPDLLRTYITDTLSLTSTEVDNPFKTVIGRTDFFDYNLISQVVNAYFVDLRYKAPSEGLLSNAEDLVKLGNAVLNSDLIPKPVRDRLFELTPLKDEFPPVVANGWIVQKTRQGEQYYGKAGKIIGGAAAILIIPDKKMVVAGAVNLNVPDEVPVFKLAEPFIQPNEEKEREKK